MEQSTMLIIVSGPDRVGKSTLISSMVEDLGESNVFVAHHSAPPKDNESIFDFYRDTVWHWKRSNKPYAIFDRAYPCSYILEQHRRRNAGHFEDVIDFEIELADSVDSVVHLGVFRPWFWSAPLHIEEVRAEHPDASLWYIRDEYIARMQEHEIYTQQLLNFYENITMFPNAQMHNEDANGHLALSRCKTVLGKS
jgi:GTPase SAR1 family protein